MCGCCIITVCGNASIPSIMKLLRMHPPSFFFLLASGLLLMAPFSLKGRIGESVESIERRILANGGIVYRDEEIKSNRQRGMPYLAFMDYLPESVELRIYFKSHDGKKPRSSSLDKKKMHPGWDIHIFYQKGKSVLEVYRRSQSMTDAEKNLLLGVLADGSFWKRVQSGKEDKGMPPTAFGYNILRDDSRIRGKISGNNSIMVFDVAFDAAIAGLRMQDQQEQAPISIKGF